MPELPEVEICRRNLERWVGPRSLVGVRVLDPGALRSKLSTRLIDADPRGVASLELLVGRVTTRWARHGKRLAWILGDMGMLLHLGMTGRWVRRGEQEEPPKAAKLGVVLEGGDVLWFADTRRFGCVVVDSAARIETLLRAGMGPDALAAPPSGPELAIAMGRRGAIKPRLMDQHRLAGVGNIQAVETLFRVGIHPWTPPERLSEAQWLQLAEALPAQLRHTVQMSMADDIVYVSDRGESSPFEVYGRAGEPCRVCGALILRETQGGRGTFWCSSCQPEPPET